MRTLIQRYDSIIISNKRPSTALTSVDHVNLDKSRVQGNTCRQSDCCAGVYACCAGSCYRPTASYDIKQAMSLNIDKYGARVAEDRLLEQKSASRELADLRGRLDDQQKHIQNIESRLLAADNDNKRLQAMFDIESRQRQISDSQALRHRSEATRLEHDRTRMACNIESMSSKMADMQHIVYGMRHSHQQVCVCEHRN